MTQTCRDRRVADTLASHHTGDASALTNQRRPPILPADLMQDDETIILMLRPSVLYVVLDAARSIMVILIITLALALAAVKIPWITWTDGHAYAFGALLLILRLAWQLVEWWSHVYVLTDRRIIRRAGVLRVSVFETPLEHIQHTSVFQRLRERLFGLGTIGFATSGSDVFETFWVMLSDPFTTHKTIVTTIRRYTKQ